MTTLREAAEQALDALVWESEGRLSEVVPKSTTDTITALRDALAEPDEVAAEREACARVCELHGSMAKHAVWMAEECAALIRARDSSETETL